MGNLVAVGTVISAKDIRRGMVVSIYGGIERVEVERVKVEYGAVTIYNGIRWTGLGLAEDARVMGYFNPE